MKTAIMMWLAFSLGGWATIGLVAHGQDKYGSLDAYIEHLREPGMWLQTPAWFGGAMFIACCAVFAVLVAVAIPKEAKS